jgi:hypothetical protein
MCFGLANKQVGTIRDINMAVMKAFDQLAEANLVRNDTG